jgi:uncharacterized phage protein gp47/JayE
MSYTAPYFDSTGLHIPTYSEIKAELVAQAQSIFGSDIYLDSDSQDMQWIAAVSSMLYDAMQMCQLGVNNQSPQTAVGTGLDGVVKLNGLARKAATYSTCLVTIIGTAGTTIASGVVQDTSGYKWDLPSSSVIGSDGVLSATVTCETAGAVTADVGTITTISTPQYGWTSVYNAAAATVGTAQETDATLRTRQTDSVAVPSTTILDGILGAVLNVDGVTRVVGYENTASSADSDGIPAHSISIVAEGGADADVAEQIWYHKTPGCGTYGTTTVDETSTYGFTTAISFYRPTSVAIDVTVTIKELTGYSDTLATNIKTYVAAYLNSLQIGTDVINSSLWGAALEALPSTTSPAFSITGVTAARHSGTKSASDIVIAFNEAAEGSTSNITVTAS